jgi:N-acylneuraminate cytidylyltransferase
MRVAVIPARGGSQRIPRKNIRPFAGKPIICHSIEIAKVSGLFDRVVVSTDDEEIAAVASNAGAEVPFLRPRKLADAFTGTNAVVKHAIEWLAENGTPVDLACCIYATAPFLRVRYLREGLQRLEAASEQIFAFSVTSFPFPIQRAIRIIDGNGIEPFFPEHIGARSQDLEEAYHDAGQFYWGHAAAFLSGQPLFSANSISVVLPRHLVQDIDTEEDWRRAESMWAAVKERKK